jgi:3-polyprenyl-4-hydroxybenzoate decarboxylase
MPDKHNITLAYTGASGTIVRQTLLKLLSGDDRVEHINVVAAPNGRKLLQLEWGVENPADMIPVIARKNAKKVRVLNDQDLTSPVTRGSYPTTAVIIAPLAVGALSRIASGAATARKAAGGAPQVGGSATTQMTQGLSMSRFTP